MRAFLGEAISMNDFLTQIFGANGVGAGQLLWTALAAVAAVALVYWIARRAPRGRSATARGRVPRLAIIDSLPIDRRRQLVLVRRDAVEHLILIGGPTDLLVEPSITRARQRATQTSVTTGANNAVAMPAPLAAAPALAAGATAGEDTSPATASTNHDAPIPFPFSRIPPSRPQIGLGNGHPASDDAIPLSEFATAGGWFGPQGAMVPILDAGPDGKGAASPFPARLGAPAGEPRGRPAACANGTGEPARGGATMFAPTESREAELSADGAAHTLSELEAEMNRLLGELAGDGRSA
jgi:hypothetical protein